MKPVHVVIEYICAINTLRQDKMAATLTNDIFKCISWNENVYISFE